MLGRFSNTPSSPIKLLFKLREKLVNLSRFLSGSKRVYAWFESMFLQLRFIETLYKLLSFESGFRKFTNLSFWLFFSSKFRERLERFEKYSSYSTHLEWIFVECAMTFTFKLVDYLKILLFWSKGMTKQVIEYKGHNAMESSRISLMDFLFSGIAWRKDSAIL